MNERNFKIRDATVADIPIILQLIRDLATYERAPNDVVATEKGLHEVLFGAEPAAKVVIAFENTEPIGFAVYFFNFSTWLGRPGLYLEDLFVKPEMRGRGYGRALLVHLAKIARDHNCGRMEWAVLTWNEPAIQFYNKLGAGSLDDWRVFRLTSDGIGRIWRTRDEFAAHLEHALDLGNKMPLGVSFHVIASAKSRRSRLRINL